MRKLVMAASAIVLAAGLSAAPALAETTSATATVQVTITVLPYAQVSLDKATPDVTMTFSETTTVYGPVYVGGTITCNCPVLLFARVNPPAEAPGDWTADTEVARVENPGVFYFGHLLRVIVWDIPPGTGSLNFTLDVTGQSAAMISEIPSPDVGEVMVTVVPE